jgi:2-oxoglutarate dehydrogenase E2 component (dihydrolipoamide succinyltransferase)
MAEIKVPELAESITEGTIVKWLKNIGDYVEKGEYLVELETDKVNIEMISDYSGRITKLNFAEGETVNVGETVAIVDESGENNSANGYEPQEVKETAPFQAAARTSNSEDDKVEKNEESQQRTIASPAARKLAREKGLNLNQVPTNDPLGRIRIQDVSSYQPEKRNNISIAKVEKMSEQINSPSSSRPIIRERMSRRRQIIAKRLVEVQQTTAMLTTFNEVDMTAVLDLRKRRKDKFYEEHDVRLGFMSFFTKAVVAALKKYPYINAEIQGDELLIKKFYDIGIAVATEEGLVVPVVKEADRKSFAEIEQDISHLAEKAKLNKLALSDIQGGTFTITNGGVFGSLLSTPILNGPQVGILGMHKIQLRPVAIDKDRMENRPMMYVALSYDHRIVDGKEAVSFLSKIKELLEDPENLLLEG